jgi:uncharacterized protein (DUF362 family)
MKYMSSSKVALVSSESYGEESKRAVDQAIGLIGGIEKTVRSGDTVLIKPNLVSPRLGGGGNLTHFSLVERLIELCHNAGADEIFVGDGSSNSDTFEAFRCSGMKKIVDRLNGDGIPVKFVDLNFDKNPETGEYDAVDLGSLALNSGHVYRVAHKVLTSDVIISVPKLKIHNGAGITVALKVMIGIAPGGYYGFPKKGGEQASVHGVDVLPHGSIDKKYDLIQRTITDLNRIMLGKYPDSVKKRRYLSVVDGIVAGAYDDLHSTYELPLWTPVKVGAIIAGHDPVAVDVIAAKLMCLRADKIPSIIRASEAGLGEMNDIEVLGDSVKELRKFVPPSNEWLNLADTRILGVIPRIMHRRVRKHVYAIALDPRVYPLIKKMRITRTRNQNVL